MYKSSSKSTPLMKQHAKIKSQYPDALLLFRVGDFYEAFEEDAKTLSKQLDIVLTKRSNGSIGKSRHYPSSITIVRSTRVQYTVVKDPMTHVFTVHQN